MTENIEPVKDITIGQLLRHRREEKNLSLKVISQQTKIHLGLLELLEKDELEKLPSKIYVRGFVKSTSKVLGLDVNNALMLLDQGYKESSPPVVEMPQDDYIPHESLDYFKSLKNNALTSSSLVAKIFIGIIFIGIIGVNVKSYLDKPSDDIKQILPTVLTTVHQKSKPAPKPVIVQTEKQKQEEAAALSAAMPINIIQENKSTTVNGEMSTPNVVTVAPSVNQTSPNKKIEKLELPKEEQKKIVEEYLPAKYQIIPPKGLHYVFLNAADGDSWITYKVDNNEIKKYVLRQGRTLFLHGQLIRLFLGNTKTIKVFYNRTPMNYKEKAVSLNLVFPEEMKAKFADPLFVFQKDGTVQTSVP